MDNVSKGGRKAKWEELKIAQRYSDLSEDFFKVLVEMLNSEEKNDKKWAAEQLSKAYVKMIPQAISNDGDDSFKVQVIPILNNALLSNNESSENISTS